MAVAQRQIPGIYPRVVSVPRRRRDMPARVRSRSVGFRPSLMIGFIAAAGLVTHVNGYARMTAMNYQRVRITQQLRNLQMQEQLLSAEIIRQRSQSAVEDWAREHGMTPKAFGATIVLGKKGEGR